MSRIPEPRAQGVPVRLALGPFAIVSLVCSAAPGTQDDVGDVRGVRRWVDARLDHI
jgi:hypothetical protein